MENFIDMLEEHQINGEPVIIGENLTEKEKRIAALFNKSLDTVEKWKITNKNTRETFRSMLQEANERFEEKVSEFSLLRRIGEEGFISTDLKKLIKNFLDIILEETGGEHGSIMLLNKEANILETTVANGVFYSENTSMLSFPLGEGIAGYAAASGEIVYVPDTSIDDRFIKYKNAPGSLISAPLKYRDDVLGVINISHSQKSFFKNNLVFLIPIITNQMALSVQNNFFFKNLMKAHEDLNDSYKKIADINQNLENLVKQRTEQLEKEKAKSDKLSILNQSIINNLNGGIIVVNKELDIIMVNTNALKVLNYEDKENMQNDLNNSGRLKELFNLFSQTLSSTRKDSYIRTEFHVPSRNSGGKQDIGTSITHLIDDDEVYGAIANFRDITYVKRIREESEASSRKRIIENMISKIAHQIRNPLNSIQGFAQLLELELDDNKSISEKVNMISNGVEVINQLINNILFYVNPLRPKYDSVNIKNLIENIVNLYSLEMNIKKMPLEQKYSVKDSVINTDPKLFRTLLFNLVVNALENVSNNGKVKINIEPYAENKILMKIENSSKEIEEEFVDSIGEPFFSLTDESSDRNHLGLGIPNSKKIANSLGIELKIYPNYKTKEGSNRFVAELIIPLMSLA